MTDIEIATQALEKRMGGIPNVWIDNRAVAKALGCSPLSWWDAKDQAELAEIFDAERTGLDPPQVAELHINALRRLGYLE